MSKPKHSKRGMLARLNEMVGAVDEKFRSGHPDHHKAAVLGMFVGELQGGEFSAEDLHEAWEEMAAIGRVVRDDFCLRPTTEGFEVIPMIGIDGLNEEVA